MKIRKATIADLDLLTKIEKTCFPESEAASKKCIKERLLIYPDCFWLLEDNNKVVSFINGMITNQKNINDIMFDNAKLHNPDGKYQAIFGVNTLPDYRNRGLAGLLMNEVINETYKQGRKGCILTCKDTLIPFYMKFGYKSNGLSKSVHGGATWYDMILEFNDE